MFIFFQLTPLAEKESVCSSLGNRWIGAENIFSFRQTVFAKLALLASSFWGLNETGTVRIVSACKFGSCDHLVLLVQLRQASGLWYLFIQIVGD